MTKNMKPFNMYCVTWSDHFSSMDDGWKNDNEWDKISDDDIGDFVATVNTLGFFVKETDNWIVMAMNKGDDGDSSCFMNILKSCILGIKKIKLSK